MRTGTEISKISLLIEGNNGILRQILYQLYLIAFSPFLKHFDGVLTADLFADQGNILLYDPLHFLLNVPQIGISEALLHIDIVVEAVFNRRSDGQLNPLIPVKMLDSLSHHMRSGVPESPAALRILKGQKIYLCPIPDNRHQLGSLSIDLCRQRLLGQAVTKGLYNIQISGAIGYLTP